MNDLDLDLATDSHKKTIESVKIHQDNNSNDNNLTNLESITLIRTPSSDKELANRK